MQNNNIWPKIPPALNKDQLIAREKFMMLWHQELPNKYSTLEGFNHKSLAKLPIKKGIKTLEIGAGLGAHSKFENLKDQDYYCLEYREEFCDELGKQFSKDKVVCGDIEKKQKWPDKTFDRIITIHVLEHLRNLPDALDEVIRLLKDDGVFDVVLPCEGKFSYGLARRISSQRLFENTFKMSYAPIILNEHVNTYQEIIDLIRDCFAIEVQKFFPLLIPVPAMNLVVALRLKKKSRE